MNTVNSYIDRAGPGAAAWLIVLIIVLMEFHHIKDFLVFIFMKLYGFFIQRNAMDL
jgi:hypothetical protein